MERSVRVAFALVLLGCGPSTSPGGDDLNAVADAGSPPADLRGGADDGGSESPDLSQPDLSAACVPANFGTNADQCWQWDGGPISTSQPCPVPPAPWLVDKLDIGTHRYCTYHMPSGQAPPYPVCTLPVSLSGMPPWQWLGADCNGVGGT
jgi:hypothetical protein